MRIPALALLALLVGCANKRPLDPDETVDGGRIDVGAAADARDGSTEGIGTDGIPDATGQDAASPCSMAAGCPSDLCDVGCCPGGPECAVCCFPKSCQNFTAAACPLDRCQVMTRCDGVPACYPPFSVGPQACGESSNYRQDVACCAGLSKRCGIQVSDGSCDPTHGGYNDFPWCLPCGNGTCDQFENRCSCPEDCR